MGMREKNNPYRAGYFSSHHRAMSIRRATQTSGLLRTYSMNRRSAAARAGLPMMRQCSPTDIILGWVSPSRYSVSKQWRADSKKSIGVDNCPRQNP